MTYVHKGKEGKEEAVAHPCWWSRWTRSPARRQPVKPQSVTLPARRSCCRPTEPAKFDRATPPRVEVQFQIDAAALAAAAGVDLQGRLRQGAQVGDRRDVAGRGVALPRPRPARTRKEIFGAKEHVSDPAGMIVQKKPLRILLFASAATHEYQFAAGHAGARHDQGPRQGGRVISSCRPAAPSRARASFRTRRCLTEVPRPDRPQVYQRGRQALRPERIRRDRGVRPRIGRSS